MPFVVVVVCFLNKQLSICSNALSWDCVHALAKLKSTKCHCQAGSGAALKDYEEVLGDGMHENTLMASAEN